MVAPAVDGIDLFKIAGCSISEWIPSLDETFFIAEAGMEDDKRQECNLVKAAALEWSLEASETNVRAETLEKAAELLVLRRNTLRIIDGGEST
jgi:hypothetical protein